MTTVKIKNKIKMIIFFIDTGSSVTYISEEVLCSFRIELADPLNDSFHVSINNKGAWVKMSHAHFKDICILGMSFLTSNKLLFNINFVKNTNNFFDNINMPKFQFRSIVSKFKFFFFMFPDILLEDIDSVKEGVGFLLNAPGTSVSEIDTLPNAGLIVRKETIQKKRFS
uniref:Uncharacterized protein n=1 Tax=Rhizophagus irregularis (strain DAOM 181602 / DAOM 197198 / MUCL 43194) TaxID=747089 RepID=U9UC36_RHIID